MCTKNGIYVIFAILLLANFALSDTNVIKKSGLYSLIPTKTSQDLVVSVNTRSMLSQHLEKTEFIREEKMDKYMSRFVFFSQGRKQRTEVSIAVCPSVSDAEDTVLKIINSVSGIYKSGTPSGVALGNTSWFLQSEKGGPGTITFIRKNVIISVFSTDLEIAESLAKKIDADLSSGSKDIVIKRSNQ